MGARHGGETDQQSVIMPVAIVMQMYITLFFRDIFVIVLRYILVSCKNV